MTSENASGSITLSERKQQFAGSMGDLSLCAGLSPEEAVDLFRELLWAEASHHGP
jgi:hypothetical protein